MCGQETATVMQSNLANGDTISLGDNCQLAFYLTVVQTILDAMPADVRAEYAAAVKTVTDALASAIASALSNVVQGEDTGDTDIIPADTTIEAPADV
jgi:hypothetical protein